MAAFEVTRLPSNRTFTTLECDDVVYHTWFRTDGTNVSLIVVDNEVVYDGTKRKHN